MILDKNGLFQKISSNDALFLDIGCGRKKRLFSDVGIDAIDYPEVDIVGDIFDVLGAFPNSSVDGIYTSHFMEHIVDLERLVKEFERVLKPGSELLVVVPHFSNPYFYSDPTHRNFFGLYTFCYYAECSIFQRKVPTYNHIPVLELKKVRLQFKSPPPFYIRYGFKKIVEWFVNLGRYNQEFYEDMFSGIFSCYDIEYTLVKK